MTFTIAYEVSFTRHFYNAEVSRYDAPNDIPLEANDYVVNGKPGIVKDANDWATETMNDPRYPLSLLRRVINVSVKTVRIVAGLPKLEILDAG